MKPLKWSSASRQNNFNHSVRFPGLSAGKNVAEQVCLSGSCLPCCLSESWGRPLPQDCRAPGLCMYRVFFPGCSWIAVFWSMNFSYCFSAPLRWLHKRRGSPWAPRAQSQRACYEEVWLCPYTLLAQVRSSDVLRGWFPCSGWWRVVLLPPWKAFCFPSPVCTRAHLHIVKILPASSL